jgi:hypothetical protein
MFLGQISSVDKGRHLAMKMAEPPQSFAEKSSPLVLRLAQSSIQIIQGVLTPMV